MMQVTQMATRPIVSVAPDSNVLEALRVMEESEISAVAVIDEGRLVGIFTVRDLARKVAVKELDTRVTRVSGVMTCNVMCALPSMPIRDAVAIMLDNHIHHLPVLDERCEVRGMVSLKGLLRSTIDDLEDEGASLDSYIRCKSKPTGCASNSTTAPL